jgi:hypothetical protein
MACLQTPGDAARVQLRARESPARFNHRVYPAITQSNYVRRYIGPQLAAGRPRRKATGADPRTRGFKCRASDKSSLERRAIKLLPPSIVSIIIFPPPPSPPPPPPRRLYLIAGDKFIYARGPRGVRGNADKCRRRQKLSLRRLVVDTSQTVSND